MRKIKNLFLYLTILVSLSTAAAMCPPDNEEELKALVDLKKEVSTLQNQLYDKQDQKGKLQKEIAVKDVKLQNIYRDMEEVKNRCP